MHRRRLFWKNRKWNMGGRECEKAFSVVLFLCFAKGKDGIIYEEMEEPGSKYGNSDLYEY